MFSWWTTAKRPPEGDVWHLREEPLGVEIVNQAVAGAAA
jgi:hypothetical protein